MTIRSGMRTGIGRSRTRAAVAACASAVALGMGLSACGTQGVYSIPLPGGADTGDHPMTITADFADVLSLVPQSAVKVGGVAVGQVKSIELAPDGWSARTTLEIRGDVNLPANAIASIKQTNLLGEKFVELDPPSSGASQGTLEDGAQIPLQRTATGTQIEEVFGALSLLLNGGGVAQVQLVPAGAGAQQPGMNGRGVHWVGALFPVTFGRGCLGPLALAVLAALQSAGVHVCRGGGRLLRCLGFQQQDAARSDLAGGGGHGGGVPEDHQVGAAFAVCGVQG